MAESQELFCSKEARLRPSDSAQVPRALPMEETSVTWSLLPLQNPMAVATHRNLVQVPLISEPVMEVGLVPALEWGVKR
uniref:Zinc finger protein 551 n=1 Tax=Rattus norvegicus TaxID=10116 RepID=A0A8I5Y616_RAT